MDDLNIGTRRHFLRNGLTLLGAAATVPTFLDRTALAMAAPPGKNARKTDDAPILVVLQLAGGNDGLNTIVPVRQDAYYRARPQLAIQRKDALSLSDDIALHPAAAGLKELYDDGLVGIVQSVGYPNPDRSHFRSTDIWETADPETRIHRGWLGRYFDCTCKGNEQPDPKAGIALTGEAPLALQGDRFNPVAFGSPEQLNWQPGRVSPAARRAFEALNGGEDDHTPDGKLKSITPLDYVQRTALDARMAARDIQRAAGGGGGGRLGGRAAGGGGALASSLRTVARMIGAGLPTRIYYVSLGGFDTHAGQTGRHNQLMRELGDGLKAFVTELRESKQLDRVMLMTFSEFGRRVAQNASQGTDHGAAAPMFLVGSGVRPGLHGDSPNLDRLDENGDLRWAVDFRSVYSEVLSRWLRADARQILGGQFKPLKLVR